MINAVLGKKAQDEMSDMKQQLTIKEVLFFWLLHKRSSCRELEVKVCQSATLRKARLIHLGSEREEKQTFTRDY